MFSVDIEGCSLYKVPKKIAKELSILKEEEKSLRTTGYLLIQNGTPGETIDELEQGLQLLQKRWVEYVSKRKPAEEIIRKKTVELEECAQVIDQLKHLALNPLPIVKEPEIIQFTENREDICYFSSVAERALAVQEAMKKLENVPQKREAWINLASSRLSMCQCAGSRTRSVDEKTFLSSLIQRYPPHPKQSLSLMSIGSGGLMPDWLILCQLEEVGYSSVNLHLVDILTTQAHVKDLRYFISSHLKMSVSINHTQNYLEFDEVKVCKPQHAIFALDFDSMLHRGCAHGAWASIDLASQCLRENGFLFCSASLKNWFFDAKKMEWSIPEHGEKLDLSTFETDQHSESIVIGVTESNEFFRSTFYYVAQLAKLKRDIVIKVIDIESVAGTHKSFSKTAELAAKVLAPHGEFCITMENKPRESKEFYDFFYATGCLIDEAFLNTYMPQVKENKIVVLNPHSYYWNEDDYNLKAEKCKKVQSLISSIEAVAQNFVQAQSLQLKM